MASEPMKPCPWCPNGGQPQISTSFAFAYAECVECGAQGPDVAADCASVEEYEAEALAAWNRRASGWVSVEERLPELNQRVLLWWPDASFCNRLAIGHRSAPAAGWSDWWTDARYLAGHAPSHWQPLPAPPSPSGAETPEEQP